jgi:UDP-GlcNAc3NAcA epimerase
LAQKLEMDIPKQFILATIHRAENTDDPKRLTSIFNALVEISNDIPIILPLHPRTKKIIENLKFKIENLKLVEPIGYLEIIYLLKNCSLVITDSGGLQKEAFFFGKPCVTLRDETEWVELVENGFNKIVGADENKIIFGYQEMSQIKKDYNINLYGNGEASKKIITELLK